jgi:hypothetical protein
VQKLKAFCGHFDSDADYAREVAAGPVEAFDEAELDRIDTGVEEKTEPS